MHPHGDNFSTPAFAVQCTAPTLFISWLGPRGRGKGIPTEITQLRPRICCAVAPLQYPLYLVALSLFSSFLAAAADCAAVASRDPASPHTATLASALGIGRLRAGGHLQRPGSGRICAGPASSSRRTTGYTSATPKKVVPRPIPRLLAAAAVHQCSHRNAMPLENNRPEA